MGKDSGGATSTPYVMSDTLRSEAYAYVWDAISEGPIFGFPDPAYKEKFIKLNGTAIQNADGTYNFNGVRVDFRWGYVDQEYIDGFHIGAADISAFLGIPAQVEWGDAHARTVTVTEPDADEFLIRLSVPALQTDNSVTGGSGLSGGKVELKIEIKDSTPGAQWVQVGQDFCTKEGKASSKYEWSGYVKLKESGVGGLSPWQVKVSRLTPDSTDQRIQNDTWFEGLSVIQNKKLTYPCVALCAVRAAASQFSSSPVRSYYLKGMIIKVPSNYIPASQDYTTKLWTPAVYVGDWDGSFKLAWSSNPAWCFFDLTTNHRYGLGDWVADTQVDKWELYEIGRYCDEMVPSGLKDDGGVDILEPRFTMNCYIQTQEEAARIIQSMASGFRSMAYWASGAVFAAMDRPTDPSYLFTPANVKDGVFSYSSTARRARHNSIVTQWNDPDNQFKLEPELFELEDEIKDTGFRFPTSRVSFGCSSRGQSLRDGRWTLFTETEETEIVSFGVGIEGAQLRPGDVFATMDPSRVGASWGGRVVSVVGQVITLDRSITFLSGTNNLVITTETGVIQDFSVSTSGSTTDDLTVVGDTTSVLPGAVWIFASTNTIPELWRVLSVSMEADAEFAVQASTYRPDKYAWIDEGIKIENRRSWINATPTSEPLTPPQGLVLSEYLYKDKEDLKCGVHAQWSGGGGDGVLFEVSWRKDQDNSVDMPPTRVYSVEIMPVEAPCSMSVSVRAKNLKGDVTLATTATLNVLGKTAPPANVTGFAVKRSESMLVFTWNKVADLDLSCYEIQEAAVWDAGTTVSTALQGTTFTTELGGTRSATFLIKAKDTSGNWSLTAASATLDIYGISDGDVLSIQDKKALAAQWSIILAEQIQLENLADPLGVDHSAYDTAVSAVPVFFSTRHTPTAWMDFTGPTVLGVGGGATLKSLLQAISIAAENLRTEIGAANMAAEIAAGATDAMTKSGFVDPITGKILWDKLKMAVQTIFASQMYMANWDNLIPNPMSEQPAPSTGWPADAWEAVAIHTGSAYAGSYCRYSGVAGMVVVSPQIPCGPGDQFCFRAMAKGNGGVMIRFSGGANSTDATSSGTYELVECFTAAAPAGTTYVEFLLSTATGGCYYDNLYARRMNDALLLVDGCVQANHMETVMLLTTKIQSANYSASGTGTPPVGFLLSGGTFETTYVDGTTDNTCRFELGGSANFGGYKVETVADRVMKSVASSSGASSTFNTSSATYVMAGMAKSFTPLGTGKIAITVSGTLYNTTAGQGATYRLRYGTGSAPSSGAAETGTAVGTARLITSVGAGGNVGFTIAEVLSGLTVGTAYWFDLEVMTSGSGAAYLQDGICFMAIEV